jgi:hypothetical protein
VSAGYTQSDLFSVPTAPYWLPDESVFSLCSRYHALSGNLLAASTCRQLFGHSRQGTSHDFPSRISEFAQRTLGYLGTDEEIVRGRTVLPYYLPLRSNADETDALSAMCGSGIGSLKFRLGILTSRFGANHPLKACFECIREDQHAYGSAYWHLSHQYPGAWVCLRHQKPLAVATEKSNGVGRFLWLLPAPNALCLRAPFNASANTENFLTRLASLTHAAIQLARIPKGFHFDPQILLRTYHATLFERELATSSGSLKNAAIGASYLDALHQLADLPELATLPRNSAQAGAQVLRMLRAPRSGTHPLRHLLLILWLFGSWEEFWQAYRHSEDTLGRSVSNICVSPAVSSSRPKHGAHAEVLRLVGEDSISVRAAAALAGVNVSTAMAWLAQAGIATTRRPKKLKADVRQALVADMKSGMDKKCAADRHGISVQTVTTTLRTEVGLHDAWTSARREGAQNDARARWQELCKTAADLGINQLRAMDQRVYAWLYRNDREWLVKMSRQVAKPKRPGSMWYKVAPFCTKIDKFVRTLMLQQCGARVYRQLSA